MEPDEPLSQDFSRLSIASHGFRDFDYASLPLNPETSHIRILSLQVIPSSVEVHDVPIKCSLSVASLEDNPSYFALSYVWGDPVRCREIIVNGQRSTITANLEIALRRLSSWFQENHFVDEDGTVSMWIDSICINQDDVTEKSSQVSKMGDIFSRATRVIAWLGEASDDSDAAVECLRFLAGLNPATIQLERVENHPGLAAGPALCRWFQRPYFKRIWILQELVLAKRVNLVCGMASIDGDSATQALEAFEKLQDFDVKRLLSSIYSEPSWLFYGELPTAMFRMRTSFANDKKFHLAQRLVIFRNRGLQASDKRDYIYGYLSIGPDAEQLDIQPDYSQPWPSVFQDATEKILKQGWLEFRGDSSMPNVLSIILASCRTQPHIELPGWVPDWSSTEPVNSQHLVRESCLQLYRAAGISCDSQASSPSETDGKTLRVYGVLHGSIESIGPLEEECEERATEGPWYNKWLASAMELAEEVYQGYEDYIEAVARTLVCDTSHTHGTIRVHPDQYSILKDVFTGIMKDPEHPPTHVDWPSCSSEMIYRSNEARAFNTSSKALGLGPLTIQLGDEVWIIIGVCVPMVLRKNGKGEHTIVGPAYVHGIMDGEFFEGTDERESISLV
ncbi:heterokaryon incompatibility [Fusarium albosuccineum]|uniref:Heterokaryon incompatibility n=1 Tax=Fusarium albosuccineum TaxID=1237068 RepID=A0A8H4LEK8_9HYPO|nr:heterokaryon incompatibility [Fusarium albosuccineum]